MRKAVWIFAALLAASAQAAEKDVVTHLVTEQIMPAHVAWQQTARLFSEKVVQFCSGKADLAETQAAWRNAQHGWAALQPALVSESVRNTIGMQASFWPDKRNLVVKQVEALLKSGEPVNVQSLTEGSVVLRGLTTSEYLLFDKGHDPAEAATRARLCPLLLANTDYQNALGMLVLMQLEQEKMVETLTQVPNKQYADMHGPLTDVFRANVTALAVMKKKLGDAVGQPGDKTPQLQQAEAWRAGDSLGSLQAGVVASRALWEGKGLRALVQDKNPALAGTVDKAYADLQQLLGKQKDALGTLLASDAGKQQTKILYDSLNALHLLYEKELAKALDVQLGFNGTDGD